MMRDMILVVDDDDSVREMVAEFFKFENWYVVTTNGVYAALEVLDMQHARVAAVLSDNHMGGYGKNGLDLFTAMQAPHLKLDQIPFFLITGERNEALASVAREAGIHVVFKPFGLRNLRDQVLAAVEQRSAQRGTEQ